MEVIEGYMLKRGSRMKTWKNRFFRAVRSDDSIVVSYFKTSSDRESLGSFVVNLTSRVREFSHEDRSNFKKALGFKVEANDRLWFLSPYDRSKLDSWIGILSKFAKPPSNFPSSEYTSQRWKSHFEAFGRLDFRQMLLDFSHGENSSFMAFDMPSNTILSGEGLAESENCMRRFYEKVLPAESLDNLVVYPQCFNASEATGEAVWHCTSAGIDIAISKIVVSPISGKVLRHFICLLRSETVQRPTLNVLPKEFTRSSETDLVGAGWRKHVDARRPEEHDLLISSYTEGAFVTVFNKTRGKVSRYVGSTRMGQCFESMYEHLDSQDSPVVEKRVLRCPAPFSCIFYWWSCKMAGFPCVVELVLMNDHAQITSHQIVLETLDVDKLKLEAKAKLEAEAQAAKERAEAEALVAKELAARAEAEAVMEAEGAAAEAARQQENEKGEEVTTKVGKGGLFRSFRKTFARGTGIHGAFSGKNSN
jgi:hypothetical protein